MREFFKRVFCFVLSILMIVGVFPFNSVLGSIKPYEPVRNYKFVVKDDQSNSEKIISEQKLTASGGFLYNPETPEKKGYKFLGWYIDNKKLEFNKNNENDDLYLNIDSFEIQKDETVLVEAKYEKYHEVRFYLKNNNSNDWEEVFETVAASSDDLLLEGIPLQLKEGEKLEDWYYDEGLKNKVEEGNIKLESESVNLYGKVIKGAWLYFDVGKFSHTVLEKQFLQGEKVTEEPKETPKRFGYTFQHWSDKDTKDDKGEYTGEKFNFGEKLEKDTKLYAVWKKDTKVKYNIRKYTQLEMDHKDLSIDKRSYKPYESKEELIEIKEGDNLEEKVIEKYLENFSNQTNQNFKNDIKGFHLPIAEKDKGNKKSISKVIEFKESDGFSPAELRVYYSRDTINIKFQDEHGKEEKTFTGLYGQKISKYEGYNWPTETYRETTDKDSDNRRVTYLDAFNIEALNGINTEIDKSDGKKSQTITLKKEVTSQKEDHTIHFYKEKLDEKGQYELSLTITSKNAEFTVTDKYVGFTADYYQKDEEQEKTKVDKNSQPIKYEKTLKIYNTRNNYDLTFNNTDDDKKIENVPYDKSLDEYREKHKKPVKPKNIPNKFIFGGWYNDSDFTNKVEWESKTMPAEKMEVYAKWEPNQIIINVHNKFNSEETVSTINTHKYGSYLNTDELPTVKQGDKVLYEGDKNGNHIEIPQGDTWDGWYVKDQKTGRYKKYDFKEKLTDNLDFYPYYYSQGTVRAYYYKNKEDWAAKKDPILTSAPHKKNIIAVISGIDEDTNSKLIGKFISWTDGEKRYFKGDNVTMDNDLHLYPIFDNNPTKTKLRYKSGEFGTGEEKIIELSNNETIILPGKLGEETVTVTDNVIFTANSGYQFDGWKNQTDGKIYKPGEKLLVDNKNDKENVFTAVWFPKPINITVEKKWQDHEGKEMSAPVEEVKVKLLRDGVELDREIELNAKNNWKGEFENLPNTSRLTGEKYSYTVKEVGEKDNQITLKDKLYEVEVKAESNNTFKITNKKVMEAMPLEPSKTKVSVEKKWQDHEGKEMSAPVEEVKVKLLRDGVELDREIELNAKNNWKGKFENLPNTSRLTGEKYSYTVKEVGEKDNQITLKDKLYEVEVKAESNNTFKITNKKVMEAMPLEPSKTKVSVEKKWQDHEGKEMSAPVEEVKVKLLRDGVELDREIELNAKNNWKGKFENLPNTSRLTGEKYNYTVKEVGEEKGSIKMGNAWYKVTYEGDAQKEFVIKNKKLPPVTPMIPPTRDIKVIKEWKDHNGKTITAPTDKITVELYKDGEATGKTLELNESNNWTAAFKKLPVSETLGGINHEYTVKEVGEEGNVIKFDGKKYKVVYGGSMKEGLTVTNEKEEPPTPPSVEKPKIPPTPKSKLPKTGYGSNVSIYTMMTILSTVVLIALGNKKKKKRELDC